MRYFAFVLLFVATSFMVGITGIVQVNVVYHEGAHTAINKAYSINSTEHIGFLHGYVRFDNFTKESYDKAIGYHLMNEIVGYNCIVIILAILVASMMICGTIILVWCE